MRRALRFDGEQQLEDFLARHRKGGTVIHNGFTHATRGELDLGSFGRRVELVIESLHGKDISRWSAYPGEDEVAFRLGAAFRVTRLREKNGTHIVHLSEIAEP